MDQKFFLTPFAALGDRAEVPNATQVDGSVSYTQGYGFDYERELGVDPDAKPIEREGMNDLLFQITRSLGAIQGAGAPEFITAADNGGSAYSYGRGAVVRFGSPARTYVSRVDNNTTDPSNATNWALLTFELATQAQATTGTDNTTLMTPLRVQQAINNSSVSVPNATTSVAGIARLATDAEAIAGSLTNVIVTPSGLAAHVAAAVPAATTSVAGRVRLATLTETNTGTSTVTAVTPSSLAARIDTRLAAASNLSDVANVGTARSNLGLGTAAQVNTGTSAANVPTVSQADARYARLAVANVFQESQIVRSDSAAARQLAFQTAASAARGGLQATEDEFRIAGGSNTVVIRPNGIGSSTGQASLTTAGVFTAPTLVASSDERLKRDILPVPPRSRLSNLVQLCAFTWEATDRQDLGVIAQRVREIAPEYVYESPDGFLAVDKAGLALECVLGLAARVAELEAR